ncbi:MAG: ribokinase [Planctomycetota bacterium]
MGIVTVIGSSNIDLVVKSPGLPAPGETVLGGEFFQAFGGKGANQAVAAARAGATVRFIGSVGDDDFGRAMRANLTGDRIDITGLKTVPGAPSGVALILVDGRGENMIAVAPGANSCLTPADIDAARPLITGAAIVLLQLEIPLATVYRAIAVAHAAGVPVALNTAPAPQGGLDRAALTQVAYCMPNRRELVGLTGLAEDRPVDAAAARLRAMGPATVIVTLGAQGVYYTGPAGEGRVAARKVTPVDTVGAGDCFAGCCAAALAEGCPLAEAIAFATAAAALSVQVRGAQPSMPHREAILAVMR